MAQHLPIQAKHLYKLKQQPENKEQQHFRLARPTHRQAKLLQTAWRYPLTARRQRPPRPTVFSSPPGGAHRAARRQTIQGPLTLFSSPGIPTRAARRCNSIRTPLVFSNSISLICYVTQFQAPK